MGGREFAGKTGHPQRFAMHFCSLDTFLIFILHSHDASMLSYFPSRFLNLEGYPSLGFRASE